MTSNASLTETAPGAAQDAKPRLRLLAVMEARTVTGAAKSMLDFCRAALELHTLPDLPLIETSIVTFDRTGSNGPEAGAPANEFVAAARALGVEVDVIEERFRFDTRVIRRLREIVEARRPDIILTHHVKSHFLMKCSGLWRRYTWVCFHHGYTTTNLKMRAYNRLDRWSLPTAARVITVCDAFARDLTSADVPRERISVQHNSIRPEQSASDDEVRALKVRLGLGADERVVLAIGRLSREKAHIDLIKAFAALRESHPEVNARLIIIGDGPERAPLESAAASLGVSERTYFAGQLSDVRPYYVLADVLALPSHSEGSPYVLLEAMAARVPVVATRVGGVPEMVKDEESALLVEASDPPQMAAALARLLTDEELAQRLSANAFALVATRYSPESFLRSLVEIYQKLLSNRLR